MTSRKKKGRIFVISAPSGTGKTTLLNRLLADYPTMKRSVSCTTRSPRPGEHEGVDYHFVNEAEFRRLTEEGGFFEWEEVHGAFYGTPKGPLVQRHEAGLDTVLDIDTRGARSVKKDFPDACLIFLMPPSLDELEQRLRSRHTEEESSLRRRLENARREMGEKNRFDYVIINYDLDRAYGELKSMVSGYRSGQGVRQ